MSEAIESLALLGWMGEDEAIHFLRHDRVGEPPPDEDSARILWQEFHLRTLAARIKASTPASCRRVDTADADRFLEAAGGAAQAVVSVDPAQLLAFQFYVAIDRSAAHVETAKPWSELCLPTQRPPVALSIQQDGNRLSFEVPHAEHVLVLTPGGQLRVDQNHPFVMVGDIGNGRLLLRGGYHRAYAYLSAHPAPDQPFLAALIDGPCNELEIPGMREKLTSSRPPLMGDFLNPELVFRARKLKVRYRFTISAEMHRVPWD